MAINIKELFVTDLDPNSGAWWSKDKVDKINYNFYLLSNGGMPGPQGTIGVDGGFGPTGAQGDIGFKGPQGYQGYQGMGSLNDWVYFPEEGGLPGYLYPRKNPPNDIQAAPVALKIGYLSNDPNYLVGEAPDGAPIQVVKVKDNDWVNLRVEEDGEPYGYNFRFLSNGSDPRFEISPGMTDSKFRIINTAQTIVFKTFITGSTPVAFKDSITITDNQITVNTSGLLGPGVGPAFNLSNAALKFTRSLDEFRFKPGAAANKVLVSTDTSGNVEWKDVKEVFGTFPIGSIVSIRANEFNPNHFWLNDSVNVTSGSPLNNIYGRGKVGTDFEGWYLCNGETWETEQGFNQYLTPNLNNFSYTIDANGDAQNLITVPESDPVLIGGYDMGISAVPSIDGIYIIDYTTTTPFLNNDTSPGNSTISMATSGSYSVGRMIHIVYLEDPNLKWSKTGVFVPPPPVNPTILLGYDASSLTICDAQVTTPYSWTGNNDWNTFGLIGSTYKLFNYGTTNFAPSRWYVNEDGYPIRWNGVTGFFTDRGTQCNTAPPVNNPNLRYSLLVDDLNGPLSSFGGTELVLDFGSGTFAAASSLFIVFDAAGIYIPGDPAPRGWYREISTGVRRYWGEGGVFDGVSFTQNYVNRVTVNNDGVTDPHYNNNNASTTYLDPDDGTPISICDVEPKTRHLTYIAGDKILATADQISQTANVKNYLNSAGIYAPGGLVGQSNGNGLYVTKYWLYPMTDGITGAIDNTPALVNIKDQFKPLSTTFKYNKVYMETNPFYADYGNLSTTGSGATGKIVSLEGC